MAIGGGEIRTLETYAIDARIVELAGKKNPTALFIPTASGDSEGYWEAFRAVYGNKLGCHTQALFLMRDGPSRASIQDMILNADLVYVGGGNTLRLMRIWRRHGVDTLLKKAAQNGVVLSGVSAGAMCWFEYGNRLPPSVDETDVGAYVRLRGLGLMNALFCPHYNSEPRKRSLAAMVSKYGGMGLGVDDNAALEIAGDTYRVLSSAEGAGVHRVFRQRGRVIAEVVEPTEMYQPIERLLETSA